MSRTLGLTTIGAPVNLGGDDGITFLLKDDDTYTLSDANLTVVGDARARAAGLALYQRVQRATSGGANAADSPFAGWANTATPSGTSALADGFVFDASSKLEEGTGAALQIATQTEGANEDLITILRSKGAYLFDANDTLLWVEADDTTATVYDAFYMPATGRRPGTMSRRRVADLVDQGYDVFGHRDLDVTDEIASPAVGNTFEHTADTVIEFTVDSVPTSFNNVIAVLYRSIDDNNGWQLVVRSNGDATGFLQLYDRSGGSGDQVADSPGTYIAPGSVVTCVVNAASHKIYADGVLRISYTDSGQYLAKTRGSMLLIATGGAISNLVTRTLDGVANVGSANHPGYGVATDVLPGPLAANDEAPRETASYCTVEIPAIPTSGTLEYAIRYVDASNYVYLEVDTVGDLDLRHVTGGAGSVSLATYAAGLSGGETLTFIDTGSNIEVLVGETRGIDHATSAHNTATKTRVLTLGTGGQLSNAINRPRTVASAPNTPGASEAKRALDAMAR